MADTSFTLRIEVSKALIVALIGLLLLPASAVISYHVGKRLGRPQVRVQSVRCEAMLAPNELDSTTYRLLATNFRSEWLERFVGTCSKDILLNRFSMKCANRFLEAGDEVRRNFNLELTTSQDAKEKVQLWVANPTKPAVFGFPQQATLPEPSKLLAEIETKLAYLQAQKEAFEALIKSFATLASATSFRRSGETFFTVMLLNEGDSDDVILPEARLKLKGETLALRTVNTPVVIKAHSVAFVDAIVDRNNKPDSLQMWRTFVSSNSLEPFEVHVPVGDTTASTQATIVPLSL